MLDVKLILLLFLIASLISLLFLAFSGPSASRVGDKRLAAIRSRHGQNELSQLEARMRRAISNRQVESQRLLTSLIPNPENLSKRIAMTGKKWTLSQYMTTSTIILIVTFALMLIRGFSLLPSLFVGIAVGFGLPHLYVNRLIDKRLRAFNTHFPDALDLLVRGLRSGLPVGETLNVVASEIPGPVGEEFRMVTERIKIGKTMDQSLQETAQRLGTAEFQFFCITLAIQRETGGNLAETLANLGAVLRQRAQMKLKIRAMSSESKASAYIIGVLPFLVFGLICWINFDYMKPFFTPDPAGLFGLSTMQVVGIGGMIWMSMGAFIMAKMINFEI